MGLLKNVLTYLFFLLIINQTISQTKNFKVPLRKNINLLIQIIPFDTLQHRITKCSSYNSLDVCLIDSTVFFGTDKRFPINELKSLKLIIDSFEINLDVSGMYNPWLGDYAPKEQFKLNSIQYGFILCGVFSDGAGSYIAEWKIIKSKSIRTLITDDENLVIEFYEEKQATPKPPIPKKSK